MALTCRRHLQIQEAHEPLHHLCLARQRRHAIEQNIADTMVHHRPRKQSCTIPHPTSITIKVCLRMTSCLRLMRYPAASKQDECNRMSSKKSNLLSMVAVLVIVAASSNAAFFCWLIVVVHVDWWPNVYACSEVDICQMLQDVVN